MGIEAWDAGHEVTAFVRSPQKVTEKHERLTLFKGSINNDDDLRCALTGKVKISFGDKPLSFSISREDIGAFMVEQLTSTGYIHSMPIIGT